MTDTLVTLNVGSSSVKLALFGFADDLPKLWTAHIDGIGVKPVLTVKAAASAAPKVGDALAATSHGDLIAELLREVVADAIGTPLVVGHRVVHGGERHAAPVRVTADIKAELAALIPLARNHQPHNLAGIDAAEAVWPDAIQVACFDTAFHRTLPPEEQVFAIPRKLTDAGIRRYGFHGLSYEWIARALPHHLGDRADGRIVVAHLGNGASLAGLVDRESRYTTMGFTPLDGLVMGRRPGRLDPGILLHLMAEHKASPAALETLLFEQSGLLGVSGVSSDMRDLLASDEPQARLAVDMFIARLVAEIGAAAAAIGGLDALVFTGGIGEHAAIIREAVVERLAWLGLTLDAAANAENATTISTHDSRAAILVIPADEERMIAHHARALATAWS